MYKNNNNDNNNLSDLQERTTKLLYQNYITLFFIEPLPLAYIYRTRDNLRDFYEVCILYCLFSSHFHFKVL